MIKLNCGKRAVRKIIEIAECTGSPFNEGQVSLAQDWLALYDEVERLEKAIIEFEEFARMSKAFDKYLESKEDK